MAKNRTKAQRQTDLAKLAEMRLEHVPIADCAKKLEVSERTIYTDLERLDELWREQRVGDVELVKARQEAELVAIKRRIWRSKRSGELTAKEALDALCKVWDKMSQLYSIYRVDETERPKDIVVHVTTRRKEVKKPGEASA